MKRITILLAEDHIIRLTPLTIRTKATNLRPYTI